MALRGIFLTQSLLMACRAGFSNPAPGWGETSRPVHVLT